MSAFDLKKLFNTQRLESFFIPEKTRSVGIDLGSNSIKIVELEKKKEGIFLSNYAFIKIKNANSLKGNVRYQASSEILKKVLRDLDWKIDSANVAIPATSSLITTVDFWASSDEEINQLIQVEASKYIPIPLDEVIYGWKIISNKKLSAEETVANKFPEEKKEEDQEQEDGKEKEEDKKKVVIVAVMKEISRRYEEVLSSCEIATDTLEVDVFSLARCLGQEDKSLLILDLGQAATNLVVVSGGGPLLAKSIDFGGDRITDLIAHFLKIDFSRADKLKLEQGLNMEPGEIKEGLATLLNTLKGEVLSAMEAFNRDFPAKPIEEVVLLGGGASLLGLPEYLAGELKLTITKGNPFEKIVLPDKIKEKLLPSANLFSVATGLALLDLERKEK